MNMTRVLRIVFWLVILMSLIVAVRGRAQHAAGPQPSTAQLTMRLKLAGANASGQMQGELTNLSERSPSAIMVKSDY
jgi:hypothetical protein